MPYHTEAYSIFLAIVFGFIYLSAIVLRKNNALAVIPASVLVILMFGIVSVLYILSLYFNAFDHK
jgi:hypothetical protein